MNGRQLTLDLFDKGIPTWDDVQKGEAKFVAHDPYSTRCRRGCLWFESIEDGRCYLFAKQIVGGMCPSSGRLEWS